MMMSLLIYRVVYKAADLAGSLFSFALLSVWLSADSTDVWYIPAHQEEDDRRSWRGYRYFTESSALFFCFQPILIFRNVLIFWGVVVEGYSRSSGLCEWCYNLPPHPQPDDCYIPYGPSSSRHKYSGWAAERRPTHELARSLNVSHYVLMVTTLISTGRAAILLL